MNGVQINSRFSCSSSFVDIQRSGLDKWRSTNPEGSDQNRDSERINFNGFALPSFLNGSSTDSDVSPLSTVQKLIRPLVESIPCSKSTDANMIGTAKVLSGVEVSK